MEAIASRLEAIATGLEAMATRLEAIASRLEAVAAIQYSHIVRVARRVFSLFVCFARSRQSNTDSNGLVIPQDVENCRRSTRVFRL